MSAAVFTDFCFGHARKEGVHANSAAYEGVRKEARRIAARLERRSGKASLAQLLGDMMLIPVNAPAKLANVAPDVLAYHAKLASVTPGALAYHAHESDGFYGVKAIVNH